MTPEQVHLTRTSKLTDMHLSRLWGIHPQTIRSARMGLTHKDHPTKPDRRPRRPGGRYSSSKALRRSHADS